MADPKTPRKDFVSQLPEARQRFLAHLVEDALELELRRPDDFVRHFPPEAIMSSLEDRPDLRAGILVLTTGIRQKIAQKKSAASAAEDLRIALAEGETDPEAVVEVFQPDDRARYLDARKLWAYTAEARFWMAERTRAHEFEPAKHLIVRMIERAIEEQLLTAEDVVDGVTVARLVEHLPRTEIVRIIESALTNAKADMRFAENDLLKATELRTLVDHVPLPVLWESVLVARLAREQDFVEAVAPVASDPGSTSELDTQEPETHVMGRGPGGGVAKVSEPVAQPMLAAAGGDTAPAVLVIDESEDIEIETDVGRLVDHAAATKSSLPWKSRQR